MTAYPHFALQNLYLVNGYHEIETSYGPAREYDREDELEQCVRRVLLRKPESLRGWDLRFLRNGLALSQADFGNMIGRTEQSVARWEKNSKALPKFVDLMIRVRFAAKFEPGMEVEEILSYVDGTARKLPEKILLSLTEAGWEFNLEQRARSMYFDVLADLLVSVQSNFIPTVKVYEFKERGGVFGHFSLEDAVYRHGPYSRLQPGQALLTKMTEAKTIDSLKFTLQGTSYGAINDKVLH